jgi:predicted anti-sigma-YlaC factor YlaD
MQCEQIKILLAGYQDGELDPEQIKMVEDHLKTCSACREELARLEKVKEVTGKVKYNDLPLEVWEGYWHGIYRRIERGLGWIFASIGVIIILILGIFHLIRDYFLDSAVGLLPKFGVGALIIGGVFLLVSIVRERIFAYNRDRYKEVQR